MLAAVIDNFGIRNRSHERIAYRHAIRAANVRVCLMSAYSLPDRGLRRALRAAARRGVQVDVMMHAKTGVIDGVRSTIGSYNLDRRSLFHNLEASVVIADAPFGAPWFARIQQWFCHLWSYWL